ncbi:MAG: hypothetical protein JXA52_07990 [Planctomycetes bacterium]|nr:hypothetical protein [Planctomycetota bacterium]
MLSASILTRFAARMVFASISILPVALGWLTAPLHFQEGAAPLISVFDAEVFPIVVQVKNLGADFNAAAEDGTLEKLPVPKIPYFEALANIFGNDAAIGITDPSGQGAVAVVRLQNLSWSTVQLFHNLSEEYLKEGMGEYLGQNNFVIAFASHHLVLGTNPELVKNLTARLEGEAFTSPEEEAYLDNFLTIKSRGVLARIRLTSPVRRYLGLDEQGTPEIFSCALTRIGEDLHLRMRSFQGSNPDQKPSEVFPLDALKTFADYAPPPLKADEVLAIETKVSRQNLQDLAANRIPTNDSILQAQRDIFDKGVLPYVDGRFAMRFLEMLPGEELPPAPRFRAAIGTEKPQAMSTALEEYVGKLIELFREPGGNEYWEAVRQDTYMSKLEGKYPGVRIHLHHLFFHNLEPYWFYRPGGDKLELGTHFSEAYFNHPAELQAEITSAALTNLHASWRLPSEELKKLKALFIDKADKHQWVPEESLATAHKTVKWSEKAWQTFPTGRLALSILTEKPADIDNKNSAFYLDIHAVFRLRDGEQE